MKVSIARVNTEMGKLFEEVFQAVFAKFSDIELVVPSEASDIMVVCGGDGFLLETVSAAMGRAKKFFGVNLGTVGFMMNDFPSHDIEPIARAVCNVIRSRTWKEVSHPLLRATIEPVHGKKMVRFATNDVALVKGMARGMSDQAVRLRIVVDGEELPLYSGDGIIVATPAGSTAYSLSAGGPPLDHRAHCIVLTPLAPQRSAEFANLTMPFVLSAQSVIDVCVEEVIKRPVRVSVDCFTLDNVRSVRVVVDHEKSLSLLYMPDWTYIKRLNRKILGIKERRR